MFSINRVIIEESKIQHNIELIKSKLNKVEGKEPIIIAVLKGNAYGIGYETMLQKLLENGINHFAVSKVSEAIDIRNLGNNNPILVLNATAMYDEATLIAQNNLTATVGSIESLRMLQKAAEENNKTIDIHLKIDTGFSRFGFDYEKLTDEFIKEIKAELEKCDRLNLVGTYTHFIEAYANDDKTTKLQFDRFINVLARLKQNGINSGITHCANSSAFFKYPMMQLDAVRIGSAFSGRLQIKEKTGLHRVGYLESEICEIREIQKDRKIGYSGTYTLKRDSKVAIVEAGYSDGIFVSGPKDSARAIDKLRALKKAVAGLFKDGNRYVVINDKIVPILGRVGMNNFMVDVTDIDCNVGDKVKIDVNLVFTNQKIERIMN